MKEPIVTGDFGERDVAAAVASLDSASFRTRFVHTGRNAPDPKWTAPGGQPIAENVRDQIAAFKHDVAALPVRDLHSGVFQRFNASTIVSVAGHRLFEPVVPTARDLFHVYGPDRDNTKDWSRYYRYAWKQKGPNAIIFSTDPQIIQQGRLSCNSYAYSGQSSYAIVGAGMFYVPQWGDATVSIRPYVQWQTSASFTGNDVVPASAAAYLGIYVESWQQSGGGHYVDRDLWIPVWTQNTQSYMTNMTAGGAATVGDGLATDILAVTQRKYAIYVYVYLETSADPQSEKNEVRFVTLDIDATAPYVVVEETLI
jgi:hypothetical protein